MAGDIDTADESRGPDGSVAVADIVPRAGQPGWLVAFALVLAVVAGVLILLLVTGWGNETSDGLVGSVACGDGKGMSMNAEYQGGNGAATPGLAMQGLADMDPSLGIDVSDWRNEGLAVDAATRGPDDPVAGSVVFLRRDGDRVTGRVIVVPAYNGTGWIGTQVTLCQE